MFHGKPIIGLTGGIGSGKTFVANLFAEQGCLVIHSDAMVHEAYHDYTVKSTLQQWWGKMIFDPRGEIDRRAVARKIFNYPSERTRLERLIHPIVNQNREKLMNAAASDPSIKAYVWDTPLLFETELNRLCDAVVFVDAPLEVRAQRVQSRGWGPDELADRENAQMPLEKKQQLADESISNPLTDADSPSAHDELRTQVKQVLDRILAKTAAASPQP